MLVIVILSALAGEILVGTVVALIQALNLISNNSRKILNTIHSLYQNNLYINQFFEFMELSEEKIYIEDIAGGDGSTVKCFAKTKGSTSGLEGGSTTGSCMVYSTYLRGVD